MIHFKSYNLCKHSQQMRIIKIRSDNLSRSISFAIFYSNLQIVYKWSSQTAMLVTWHCQLT